MRLRFQKGDIVAVVMVLLLAVFAGAGFLPVKNDEAAYAEIYLNGEHVQTVSLHEEQEFTIASRYDNIIAVKNGKIAVIQSDCPGEDCVHSGWIGSTAKSIVCLPNELEIRVVAEPDDVDFVVR